MWSRPPYEPAVVDGWLYGRGSGDMKAGIVCAMAAYKALLDMGLRPAGTVGFNAVLNEEDTGAGTLATLNALSRATARARLEDFDAVIIPEPFGEAMLRAQVGVCWMFVDLTGKPAHVAYMGSGVNPIEAGIAIMADLKELETQWNAPEHRHPAFADQPHPINFNLGRIEGGEWNSSVPCTCTLGIRFSFYPDMTPEAARDIVAARVRATVARLNPALTVQLRWQGQFAPGCEFDLDAPAMRALAAAHEKATGKAPAAGLHRHHRRAPLPPDDRPARDLLRPRGAQHPWHRRIRVDRQHEARGDGDGAVHRGLVRRGASAALNSIPRKRRDGARRPAHRVPHQNAAPAQHRCSEQTRSTPRTQVA